ncbi:hypothetical protein RIF29_30673 [Crotalaria pallida]|uniref:Uncharacterized protein n=1 Tax=Crotalaria pallida TaxID=3830 RepID=A0AAN9ELL4_CROPI
MLSQWLVHYYVQSHIQINECRVRVILPSASKKHRRPITTCVKVLDMTGLKLSALNQIKMSMKLSVADGHLCNMGRMIEEMESKLRYSLYQAEASQFSLGLLAWRLQLCECFY